MSARSILFAAVAVVPLPSAGQTQHDPPDFFAGRDVVEFVVLTDLPALLGDRDQDSPERRAEVGYFAPDGSPVWIPITVKTRGKFRLDPAVCGFPPLLLDFPARRIRNTVFDGQNRLRMVTHCRPDPAFQQYVLLEYLAYRAYELLTPNSFRTRLARVTYVDSTETVERMTRYAFLIEDVDDLAERRGMAEVEVEGFHGLLGDPFEVGVHDVFQYMIGNTDWSTFLSQNVRFIQRDDGQITVVPFDFDWSGLVSAPYAVPAPDVPIADVRQRFYMGVCRLEDHLTAVFQHFVDRRSAIYDLFSHEGLTQTTRRAARSYLDDFYETITTPRLAKDRIRDACRY